MVLSILAGLLYIAKVRYSYTFTDSIAFRLHYHWTTSFCFISAILITASDLVGNPIQCMIGYKNADKPVTTYCWISSTYTINTTGPIKGIGTYHPKVHEKTIHSYYQWVPAVLFLQAFLFYLPHMIWKSMEGKRVNLLLQDLNKGIFDNQAKEKKENIIKYIMDSWGMNVKYSMGYLLCTVLNLVNVVGQMYLINKFLGGFFMDYGTKVFSMIGADDTQRNDPMIEIFPRITKCLFRKFGPSGTIVGVDAICVLPQNIINEKIYLVMWIWFIFLMIVTSLQIVCRLALFYSSYLRVRLLSHRTRHTMSPLKLEQVVRHMQLGEYCLIDTIGSNLDTLNFIDILDGVTKEAEKVHPQDHYRPIYPSIPEEVETLPRRRHLDHLDIARD